MRQNISIKEEIDICYNLIDKIGTPAKLIEYISLKQLDFRCQSDGNLSQHLSEEEYIFCKVFRFLLLSENSVARIVGELMEGIELLTDSKEIINCSQGEHS